MTIPKFIQYANEGAAYILCTSPPGYIGKVVQFNSEEIMLDWIARKKADNDFCIAGKVPEHSILVIYSGAMEKPSPVPESTKVFHEMAMYYWETRVKGKGRYKKYLETTY